MPRYSDSDNPLGYVSSGADDAGEPFADFNMARRMLSTKMNRVKVAADPQDGLDNADLARGYLDPVVTSETDEDDRSYRDFMDRPNEPF